MVQSIFDLPMLPLSRQQARRICLLLTQTRDPIAHPAATLACRQLLDLALDLESYLPAATPFEFSKQLAPFRGVQAGSYRATSPVMSPSTAFGLILNLAAIEMRDSLNEPITKIKKDLPRLLISIGIVSNPERCSLYQQLHCYLVGKPPEEMKVRTKGAKYWIAPVRREILVDYDGIIGVQSDESNLLERVRQGLRGELEKPRYGLPFAGDNNLLFDRIDVVDEPPAIRWYTRIHTNDPPRKDSCRRRLA